MVTARQLPGGDDTIVALATAAGRGAIAVIRLSGARAIDIARALGAFGGASGGASGLHPRRATRVALHHPNGEPLDDAVVTWFAAPRSYTGDDVVEISTHGGHVVPALVLAACVAAGARPATPGEFTRRAVLNGRMDLVQAEAVADLIDARTTAMHRQALSQLDGGLSRRLLALRDEVIHLEALIAYDIDFPEEDDGPIVPARINHAAESLRDAVRALMNTAPQAAVLRDGVLVVIAGPPNAGKSSLFNALLGESRALVTPIAGTTRDAIEAVLDRAPLPLRFVDTAGLRDTDDEIERLGIEVSTRYLAQAQVVLACGATAGDIAATHVVIAARTAGTVIPVHTKADLSAEETAGNAIGVSAETGQGLRDLLEAIDGAAAVSVVGRPTGDDVVVTRERHRAGLSEAHDELCEFLLAWESGALPAPVAAVHLYAARESLSDLIGIVDTEDVLDRVFREFCIGK
ncbi:tRNA uridine-5-carboxymethylaminomethyl(34) synthesis GTPase MnmE [Gemmatimonas sp.]|uniref:tRNA uridine-5-carboxymethylaminomethyl(34) synthesis GTPase MnmE n=1 Tax=Gemmatimonas sp. TaxID=1962908 RepID=UPI00286CD85E|nr:tRNA uridine-5-carboxymethylaminomethyl(34) synthesis GTPase MnmE [Gemmatimonas sp.]